LPGNAPVEGVSDFFTLGPKSVTIMQVMLIEMDLPEDVFHILEQRLGDLSQYTRELLAVEGYRSGALTAEQLHRMLSERTQTQVEALLKSRAFGQ
jgi:hypothetical protein